MIPPHDAQGPIATSAAAGVTLPDTWRWRTLFGGPTFADSAITNPISVVLSGAGLGFATITGTSGATLARTVDFQRNNVGDVAGQTIPFTFGASQAEFDANVIVAIGPNNTDLDLAAPIAHGAGGVVWVSPTELRIEQDRPTQNQYVFTTRYAQ